MEGDVFCCAGGADGCAGFATCAGTDIPLISAHRIVPAIQSVRNLSFQKFPIFRILLNPSLHLPSYALEFKHGTVCLCLTHYLDAKIMLFSRCPVDSSSRCSGNCAVMGIPFSLAYTHYLSIHAGFLFAAEICDYSRTSSVSDLSLTHSAVTGSSPAI